MKTRTLKVGIGSLAEALGRFNVAFERIARDERVKPERRLTFASLPQLAGALTPARWRLLEVLRKDDEMTIYALAKRLGRNYKNVHTDVVELGKLGLVEKTPAGRVCVPWDVISAEMRIAA